jgi:transposase
MKTRKDTQQVFKPYVQNQISLMPANLNDMIPPNHLVRVINEAIDQLDLELLVRRYQGGGTSAYHPRMMLKVLLYAFSQRIYASRRIAKALREDITFIWLSGSNTPDFRTINDFRGQRMQGSIEKVFAMVVGILYDRGQIKFENYFVDGTKIEANANRGKVIWAKKREGYARKAQEEARRLLREAEEANRVEQEEYGDRDLEEVGEDSPAINAEELKARINKLNEELQQEETPLPKKKRSVVRKLEKECLPKLIKYEEQAELLAGRNSCSVTDPDATCMLMKEDRGAIKPWPKPAYNFQLGTEGQFIVGYSLHQRAGDTSCFVPHLEELQHKLERMPENIIADAGYGSEENYAYLEKKGLGNYVKYNTFYQETRPRRKPGTLHKNPFHIDNFTIDALHDEYICPQNRRLRFERMTTHTSDNGYVAERAIYTCENCLGCPDKARCTTAPGNRQTYVSRKLRMYKQQARENLTTEEGKALRARRSVEVESVFGHLKHNLGIRRFLLRGLEKVKIELGLAAIAYDLRKLAVA